MAIDLTVRRKSLTGQTHEWLASAFGTDACRTTTLNLALFDFVTAFPNAKIPAGVLLGKVTATNKYGPYADADITTGLGVAVGILFMDVDVKHIVGTPTGDVIAPLLWRGDVIEAKLPAGSGVDAAGKADLLNRISFT